MPAPSLSPAVAPRLAWPAPALLAWLGAWGLAWSLLPLTRDLAVSPAWAGVAGAALAGAVALGLRRASAWRRLIVAGGFPASAGVIALSQGLARALPAWAWLLPLALLLAAYPLRAWRDAPLFPTPSDALAGLADAVPLPPDARVMDAGCGLGHGLAALRAAYPQARFEGVEWSWPLRLLAALRCPWARVRRDDMWAVDWSQLSLVYLFQRPESMARALAKAQAEMAPGSWLVSLDFAVPAQPPTVRLQRPGAQAVWAYRIGPPMGEPHTAGSTRAGAGR